MTLVTHSEKRNRTYERVFDHDEARELRAQGWPPRRIADHFGVSTTAVNRILDPALAERMAERTAQYLRDSREPCKGGCGTLVYVHQKGRTGYCHACLARLHSAVNEREGELRCTKCGEWKPDACYQPENRVTRRGHRSHCRNCETKARRRNRAENHERERAQTNAYKRRDSKKRQENRMTEFVVLTQNGAGLKEVARVEAVSRLHAVEQAATEAGEYVVVKADAMKPMRVEPVTRLSVVKD